MPKMKTHKGTKKRFRLTAKGHVKHRPAGTSHLQTRGMTPTRKRKLRGTRTLDKNMESMIHRAVGKYSY
jgi:large subunit ribosomal protein L35